MFTYSYHDYQSITDTKIIIIIIIASSGTAVNTD